MPARILINKHANVYTISHQFLAHFPAFFGAAGFFFYF